MINSTPSDIKSSVLALKYQLLSKKARIQDKRNGTVRMIEFQNNISLSVAAEASGKRGQEGRDATF